MKRGIISTIAFAGLLCFALSIPTVNAQESPQREQMHESRSTARQAVSDTGQSLKHAYHATTEEAHDAALTTKVKTALLRDRETRHFTIHVKSEQGTVTLAGVVDSPATAEHARSVVAAVHGVESVNNRLTWHTSER